MPKTESELLDEVKGYLRGQSGASNEAIEDGEPLLGGLIDSIGLLSLTTHLESAYGIAIAGHEVDPENFGTLRALASFLARKIGAA